MKKSSAPIGPASSTVDYLASLTLELTTDDIEVTEEVPADSWGQLAGRINGNLGMFFGLAVFRLTYSK